MAEGHGEARLLTSWWTEAEQVGGTATQERSRNQVHPQWPATMTHPEATKACFIKLQNILQYSQ